VPCLAGHSSFSRCRSHSLAIFDVARHHRTSITPGGMATGGLYSTYETARANRREDEDKQRSVAAPSLEPYGASEQPPDQLAPGETTRDRVAVESVPPTADRPEPDGFSGVPAPNMSELGSPLFALSLGKAWVLTGTRDCVPRSSVTAAWKPVCALSMEPILFALATPCGAPTDMSCQSSSKPDIQIAILCALIR